MTAQMVQSPLIRPPAITEIPVIIMAGGKGTRLGHLTRKIPKPLVHVAGRPVIEHILDNLIENGIRSATITLHHLPEAIPNHLKDGRERGLEISYSPTFDDWGSAGGALRASRGTVGDPILIISGDVITNVDYSALLEFHLRKNSPFTIALTHVEDATEYGVIQTDGGGRVESFIEKPLSCPTGGCSVSAGIYIANREILERIPGDLPCDFGRDFIPALVREGLPVHACILEGYWFDIGTVKSLRQAEKYLSQLSGKTLIGCLPRHHAKPHPPSIWV